jgi:hypothetical protein
VSIFHKNLNERLADYLEQMERASPLPENWFWQHDKVRSLERIDERIIEDLKLRHVSMREEYDAVAQLMPLLKQLHGDLEHMLQAQHPSAEEQAREAQVANDLLGMIGAVATWFEKDYKKYIARDKKAKKIQEELTGYLSSEIPDAAKKYEVTVQRFDYRGAGSQDAGIHISRDGSPTYVFFVQPRDAPEQRQRIALFDRKDLDNTPLNKSFADHRIPSFGESLIEYIDDREVRRGFTTLDANRLLLEHIRELRELGVAPRIWPWYDFLAHRERIGTKGWVRSEEQLKTSVPSHVMLFNDLLALYRKQPQVVRASVAKLHDALEGMLASGQPYTSVQKAEAAVLRAFAAQLDALMHTT